jgi:hypothetical protein
MTTNEIIKELLVYDGYTFHDTTDGVGFFTNGQDEEGFEYWYNYSERQDYLTDLNILHCVAVKVVTEMLIIMNESDDILFEMANIKDAIMKSMFDLPINGEYITLATATAEAIQFINKKTKQNGQ